MDRASSIPVSAEISVGFITALVSEELFPCEDMLKQKGWAESPSPPLLADAGITRWSKILHGQEAFAHSMAIGRMGQVSSALETFAFLLRCRPMDVFLTGIAGSLVDDKIHKADVVVATSTRWRTQNKVFGDGECDQYRPYNQGATQHNADTSRQIQMFLTREYPKKIRNTQYEGAWNVSCGEVFTWDYVLNSARIVKKITDEFPEALCVEMEAGGFSAAVRRYVEISGFEPVRSFVVRGISDSASNKDSDPIIRAAASKNAAEVAINMAEYLLTSRIKLFKK